MKEFADALGMKDTDLFVKKMFSIVDKDNDQRISFQEFLDMIVLFSKGRTDDKLQIIFDMCDTDKNGTVDKEELSELLNSLIDIAKTPHHNIHPETPMKIHFNLQYSIKLILGTEKWILLQKTNKRLQFG